MFARCLLVVSGLPFLASLMYVMSNAELQGHSWLLSYVLPATAHMACMCVRSNYFSLD